ncbi:NADH dehydrogenase [ubiquinone] 1 alpha subcomplex assembly factor 3 [Culicoides brevitarsis]|uniref:NADH dehydrogenase [ubiquinone] 1 alpha subcomplex assembly factor 3 n=1 Tax=Culicoides brevitarsis TaxID=469753 RepID=UPI00307B9DDD
MAQLGRQIIRNLARNGLNVRSQRPVLSCQFLKQNINKSTNYGQIRSYSGAYDCDGKTTMSLLNADHEYGLMVDSYSQLGFRLNNRVFVLGPMAIFPKTVLSWDVASKDDIDENSLRLIALLEPKIDILILGIGDAEVDPNFMKKILAFMKKYKINVEVLRTEQACSTFNFLNAESRMVAALLIPPMHMRVNEDELYGVGDALKLRDDDPFVEALPSRK